MKILASTAFGIMASLISTLSFAVPINGTGLVTPDVIFGSGNANGSWTGVNTNGVELGLRGKLRYNLGGGPENTFNYDGDRTYTFDPTFSTAPANRSIFNFEFSINSNTTAGLVRNLSALTYRLDVDTDPSAAIVNLPLDPINNLLAPFFYDHAIGINSTGNGGGTVAADAPSYQTLLDNNNVAQNSWNLGFGFSASPQALGIYTFGLSAFDGNTLLAQTSIDVIVGAPTVVPVPATLPLIMGGLALLAFMRRRG